MKHSFIPILALTTGLLASCQIFENHSSQRAHPVRFTDGVDTVLESRCLECHNHVNAKEMGGLNLETRETAFSTGAHAPVIVPGSPERSMLYRVLEVDDLHPVFMPPTPDRLWENELKLLKQWIADGADWPSGSSGTLVRPQDWPESP